MPTVTIAEAPLGAFSTDDIGYGENPWSVIGPVARQHWLARTNRGYEVLWHEVICKMVADPNLDSIGPGYYQAKGASPLIEAYATDGMLPLIPGPRHDRIRKVLAQAFTAKRINDLRPLAVSVAHQMLDRLEGRPSFDLVEDFSHRYPLEVLCALIGVPAQDIDKFSEWTVALGLLSRQPLAPHVAAIDHALVHLYAYLRDLVAQFRAKPQDSFVATLIAAEAAGDLTEPEMMGALINLLFAGHDTTRYQFGWVIHLLMQHRDQWAAVVSDPKLAPGAVEEALRLEPSLHGFLRRVTADVVYHDVLLPAGTFLTMNSYAANRDFRTFSEPDRFDIRRPNANKQLTFGRGGHLCLGNGLARLEMIEALKVFAERLPRLHEAGEMEFGCATSSMRGAEKLPLTAGLASAA